MKLYKWLKEQKDIQFGSVVSGEGVPTSDFTEYFGASIKTGIYLGNNRIYADRSIYPLNPNTIKLQAKPTTETIKKANDIIKKYKLKKDIEQQRLDKKEAEYNAKYMEVVDFLQKNGFDEQTKNVFIKTISDESEAKRFVDELSKFGYVVKASKFIKTGYLPILILPPQKKGNKTIIKVRLGYH